jgi:hypothetical protein
VDALVAMDAPAHGPYRLRGSDPRPVGARRRTECGRRRPGGLRHLRAGPESIRFRPTARAEEGPDQVPTSGSVLTGTVTDPS